MSILVNLFINNHNSYCIVGDYAVPLSFFQKLPLCRRQTVSTFLESCSKKTGLKNITAIFGIKVKMLLNECKHTEGHFKCTMPLWVIPNDLSTLYKCLLMTQDKINHSIKCYSKSWTGVTTKGAVLLQSAHI